MAVIKTPRDPGSSPRSVSLIRLRYVDARLFRPTRGRRPGCRFTWSQPEVSGCKKTSDSAGSRRLFWIRNRKSRLRDDGGLTAATDHGDGGEGAGTDQAVGGGLGHGVEAKYARRVREVGHRRVEAGDVRQVEVGAGERTAGDEGVGV